MDATAREARDPISGASGGNYCLDSIAISVIQDGDMSSTSTEPLLASGVGRTLRKSFDRDLVVSTLEQALSLRSQAVFRPGAVHRRLQRLHDKHGELAA
jgi:hypothetical protein